MKTESWYAADGSTQDQLHWWPVEPQSHTLAADLAAA